VVEGGEEKTLSGGGIVDAASDEEFGQDWSGLGREV
jgi:hypothetical protein